jgi:hypothetical protein
MVRVYLLFSSERFTEEEVELLSLDLQLWLCYLGLSKSMAKTANANERKIIFTLILTAYWIKDPFDKKENKSWMAWQNISLKIKKA